LYRNTGALTPGTTPETVDGMALAKINRLINDVRYERFRWAPARRIYIPKADGKRRPLEITSWSDKLLQEVIRSILDAYYEPQFSDHAHGFRPGRGCHTALREIQHTWTGTRWFIEGDITSCFDSISQEVVLNILAEKLHDQRFCVPSQHGPPTCAASPGNILKRLAVASPAPAASQRPFAL
jgi:retron-type reverse transcriptase